MELSRITRQFTESIIRDMTRVALRHPGSINLAQGFPDFPAPEPIKRAAIEAIQNDMNQYAVTWGITPLREGIATTARRYNGIEADPDKNITVTCGSTEAMMASLKAIINPGDEIIIFEPFYENYGPDCLLSRATPRYIRLRPPDWSFDFEELERLFNHNTKAIVINTPNNPTGKVLAKKSSVSSPGSVLSMTPSPSPMKSMSISSTIITATCPSLRFPRWQRIPSP